MSEVHDIQPSATIARHLLGHELHQLRAERSLTLQTVASALYLSASKLSRIETGRHRAAPADINRLIDFYDAPRAVRERVQQWAVRAMGRSGYHSFADVTDAAMRDYLDMEPSGLRAVYAPGVIPAVLRTRRYAGELLATAGEAERERRLWLLALRQQRFAQLARRPVRVLLAESALDSRIGGPEVMREQAALLREAEGLGFEIAVLPSAVAARVAPGGAFALTVLGDAPLTMAAAEEPGGILRLVPDRGGRATGRFESLWHAATAGSAGVAA
ncbi:Scr1 family TA system antitoxin-like transcriptional regulator [Streptomyces sp. NPDC050988]|uniref:Scr1 family TA system antitoxin-like transcriptional regulator n=1 Tax=Streptomyces sp. NPDC050988 TaxID=3365637 RepID=UPI00378F8E9C